eukprot:6165879-Pyramimonas_sp.AAC.1
MRSGLADPFAQRPLIKGLPWRKLLPWDDKRLEVLAEATATPMEDMEEMLRDLAPGPHREEERHRFLL